MSFLSRLLSTVGLNNDDEKRRQEEARQKAIASSKQVQQIPNALRRPELQQASVQPKISFPIAQAQQPIKPQQSFIERNLTDKINANSAMDRYNRLIAGGDADYVKNAELQGEKAYTNPIKSIPYGFAKPGIKGVNTLAGATKDLGEGVDLLARTTAANLTNNQEARANVERDMQKFNNKDLSYSGKGGILGTGGEVKAISDLNNTRKLVGAIASTGTDIGQYVGGVDAAFGKGAVGEGAISRLQASALRNPLVTDSLTQGGLNTVATGGRQLSDGKLNVNELISSGVTGAAFPVVTRGLGALGREANKEGGVLRDTAGSVTLPSRGRDYVRATGQEPIPIVPDTPIKAGAKLHPEDQQAIVNFLDSQRGVSKLSKDQKIQAEIDARNIARYSGLDPELPPSQLAQVLDNTLQEQGYTPPLVKKNYYASDTEKLPTKSISNAELAKQAKATEQVAQGIDPQRTLENPLDTGSVSPTGTSLPDRQPGLIEELNQIRKDRAYNSKRSFISTIIEDDTTNAKLKKALTEIDSSYNARNTKALQTKAANLVRDSEDLALKIAQGDKSDIGVAVGSELIKKLQSKGNYEQAIQVADTLARNLTEAGRTAQAASIYGKLTPEGVLRFTQKELRKYNEGTGKNIKLSEANAKALTERAAKIQKMVEGKAKTIEIAKLRKDIQDLMPATAPQILGTLQTMAQLLNPKTIIRNLGGNTIFGGLENVSQTLGAPLDKAISAVRGSDRTVALPSLSRQAKGAKAGFLEEYNLAKQGIDVGNPTQFELGSQRTFKGGALGGAETTMNVVLRAPDEAARRAAYEDVLGGLKKANKTSVATPAMEEAANAISLYRTFQDNSKAAQVFSGLKKVLNTVGIERNGSKFGLGDFVLKYPKTPGNILARGVDYSPAGLIKGIFEVARPLWGKEFRQAKFVNDISRATVGTGGLVGAGAVLGSLGIITEKPESDADLRALQKKSGLGGYQINTSALKRFILSGFSPEEAKIREGDKLVSYDWAQPAAIPLSAGAAIGKGKGAKEGAGKSIDAFTQGVQTLADQPLVQGVQDFFGSSQSKDSGVEKVVKIAKGIPASFVPTLSNQAGQLTDNTTRNTSDPNPVQESINMVKGRIPGLRNTLPARVDVLGDRQETYQGGSNNIFNVLFNPAFTSNYKPSPEAKLALDIYQQSGETKQVPRSLSKNQTIDGKQVTLTGQQQADLQTYVGQKTKAYFQDIGKNPDFNSKTNEDKAKMISGDLSDIVKAGKVNVLGDSLGSKPSTSVKALVNDPNSNLKYSTSSSSSDTAKEYYKSPDAEYNAKQAEFDQKVKAGEYPSAASKIKAQKELNRLKVGKDYSKDVRDLYTLSKQELSDYLSTDPKGAELANQLIDYDKKLKASGITQYLKFKTGIAPKAKGSGKGKGSRKGSKSSKAWLPPSKSTKFNAVTSSVNTRKLLTSAKVSKR